ncbi:MAG: MBL fold metallo-hydrolase [Ignavibacteriales bacterium]|nr:MBL fold metallo-hydrolase [Ignavibacteriales bacterium]
MTIKFIGTGSGIISEKRFHSSILLETEKSNLLIDVGDGISKALLFQKIPFCNIQNILITHSHPDHLSGIASLIMQMKLQERLNPLNIFIPTELLQSLNTLLKIHYLFPENLKFKLNLVGCDFNIKNKLENNFYFIFMKNSHITEEKIINHIYKNIGFVSASVFIHCEDMNIAYTSDIGKVEDLYLFDDLRCNLFISESTHISNEEIYRAFIKSGSEKLILTHIENEMEIYDWYQKLTELQRNSIIIAEDGMSLDLKELFASG